MQFGLFMMPLHPPHRAFADGYDRDVDQIVLADQLGFHEAWVGEHLTERWENAPAPDLLLAQALALTKNVRLGTGVTLLALHNPVYLAHRLAMLDHMARGRFQWGIGGGGIPTDLSLFGLDHTNPAAVRGRSAEVGGGPRASASGPRTELRAASVPESRRHGADGVDQAGAVHVRRGGDGRLLDGERVDRRRPGGMRGQDPAALRRERRLRSAAIDHHGLRRCRMGPRKLASLDGPRGASGRSPGLTKGEKR